MRSRFLTWAAMFSVLLVVIALAGVVSVESSHSVVNDGDAWGEWVEAYRMVADLYRAGVNVTRYMMVLNHSLAFIEKGEKEKALKEIEGIMPELSDKYSRLGEYALVSWARKSVIVAGLLAISPFFYYFFPRIYLKVWFRLKRRWWVVKE